MAISKNKSIGDLTGKVGKTVLYEMYGKMVARSSPVWTKKTTTPQRKKSQNTFRNTHSLLKTMLPFIRVGFCGYTENHSAFMEAMSVNLQQNIFSSDESGQVDYSQVILSMGELPGTTQVTITRTSPLDLEVSWDKSTVYPGSANDQVMLLFYCPARKNSFIVQNAALRKEGKVMVTLPSYLGQESLEGYISFISPDLLIMSKKQQGVSDSWYIGQVE